MKYTLHIDESGRFEEAVSWEVVRVVAGVLLPASKDAKALQRCFADLQKAPGLPRDPFHAMSWKGRSTSERREWAMKVLGAAIRAGYEAPHGVLLLQRDDLPGLETQKVLDSRTGANRYYRAMLRLVVRVLRLIPGIETGDEVDICVASRVFPLGAADRQAIEELGYKVFKWGDGKYRARVMDRSGLSRSLTVALDLDPLPERALVSSVQCQRFEADARYVLADHLANLAYREVAVSGKESSGWSPSSCFLPAGWRLTVLDGGPAGDALADAVAAEDAGDISEALLCLGRVPQPAYQMPLVDELTGRIRRRFSRSGKKQRESEMAVVEMVERMLAVSPYGRLNEIEKLARIVAEKARDPRLRRRAWASLLSVHNHRGEHKASEEAYRHVMENHAQVEQHDLSDMLTTAAVQNRQAVSSMNLMDFEGALGILEPLEKQWSGVVASLEKSAETSVRLEILGKIAGTMAQARCHLKQWKRAERHFETATDHLGQDNRQASYRAFAAIGRGDRTAAREWAARSLGSERSAAGYDLERGTLRLESAASEAASAISAGEGFDACLLVQMAERGWVPQLGEVASGAARAFLESQWTHHPVHVLGVSIGRLCSSLGMEDEASSVWEATWERRPSGQSSPVLVLIAGQALAHLGKQKALRQAVKEQIRSVGQLERRFRPILNLPGPAMLREYLDQFTYLYR